MIVAVIPARYNSKRIKKKILNYFIQNQLFFGQLKL